MNGAPLTFQDLAALLAFVGGLAGLWWRLEAAIAKAREDAQRRVDVVTADLAEYKTEVAKDYARNGYLREVEDRVLKRIDGLTSEIHGLRADFSDAIKLLVTQGSGHTTKRRS